MNKVILIGRLTRDPETRYTTVGYAVCTFTIAVDRITKDDEKKADFLKITTFRALAENCDRFLQKGSLVGIEGSLRTGSYKNKNGETIYTTEVSADRVEFLDSRPTPKAAPDPEPEPEGFTQIQEDIPF